jgi:hypothetical protein
VWVEGVKGSPISDVSRMFLKFVFGSFFESFGVNPSGELFGAWGWKVPVSFHPNGMGLRVSVTLYVCCSVSLILVKYDVTPCLRYITNSNLGKNMRCNTRLR